MSAMSTETSMGGGRRAFEPTRWSLILQAKRGSRSALSDMLSIYWKPAYFYVRRWGTGVEDAKDLTQSFFAEFLRRDFLEGVARERGRFRSFLLTTLRHHLVNESETARAKKRGGGKAALPLDFADAEQRYRASKEAPEAAFNREWALTVLERALSALAREMPKDRFDALRAHLSPGEAPAYEETARRLDGTVTDVKNLLHGARKRYRELIREEVRCGVRDESEVDAEVRDLFAFL